MKEHVSAKAPENWWEDFFEGLAVQLWLEAIPEDHSEREAERGGGGPRPAGRRPDSRRAVRRRPALAGTRATRLSRHRRRLVPRVSRPRAASPAAPTVMWEHRDMRDLPWPARFDGAFCLGDSFGYLDDNGNAKFLRAVGASHTGRPLRSRDTHGARAAATASPGSTVVGGGQMYLLVKNEYDHTRSRLEIGTGSWATAASKCGTALIARTDMRSWWPCCTRAVSMRCEWRSRRSAATR